MNLLSQRYSTGQVLAAARIGNPALQTWIHRGVIVGAKGEGVDMPGKSGVRREFSFNSVMQIAVASALIEVGVKLATAFEAGKRFAHTASGDRRPGLPFRDGLTFLAVAGDKSVVLSTDSATKARERLGGPEGVTMLDAAEVFDRVCGVLGLHPEALCEVIYSGKASDIAEAKVVAKELA